MASPLPDKCVAWAQDTLFMQGFEDALLGLSYDGKVIYDYAKVLEIIITSRQNIDAEDAAEIVMYQLIPELNGKAIFAALVTLEEIGGLG